MNSRRKMSDHSGRFSIGYALATKKVESFIQLSLVNHAKQRGIHLIPIDISKPLTQQGPFDCIIHKLYSDDWKKQLQLFKLNNPNVPVIDSPEAIDPLHNRISMLQVVNQLQIPSGALSLGIPKQVLMNDIESLSNFIEEFNLNFPVIAKQLVADGSTESHEMSLVFNREGLSKVQPPMIIQEFVNHGGVIFKVYVAGDYVQCVKRRSLPDVSGEILGNLGDTCPFAQISNLHKTSEGNDSASFSRVSIEEAELPPLSFIESIARGLQQVMKLHLFNFDMIRDGRVGSRYLVIDINYFPGYAKMPGYETMLTDFFWDVVTGKKGDADGAGTDADADAEEGQHATG